MKAVANRVDHGTSFGKGVVVHVRCLYSLQIDVARGRVAGAIALKKEVAALADAVRGHPSICEILGVVTVSPSSHRLLTVQSALSLRDVLDKQYLLRRALAAEAVEAYLRQAAAGLSFLHASGITVGTLCPERFVVDSTGAVRVADFALAKLRPWLDSFSFEGDCQATVPYLAPEVERRAKGGRLASAWGIGGEPADNWALGVVFFELALAPAAPWVRAGAEGLSQAHDPVPTSSDEVARFAEFCGEKLGVQVSAGRGHDDQGINVVPAVYSECVDALKRNPGMDAIAGAILPLLPRAPSQRSTVMLLPRVLPKRAAAGNGADRRAAGVPAPGLPFDLQRVLVKRSKTVAEDVLAAAFENSETDLSLVVSSLEATQASYSAKKADARGVMAAKLAGDPPTADASFRKFDKWAKAADEHAYALLRDKGKQASCPTPVVPLLFRTPAVYCHKQQACDAIGEAWAGPTATTIPASWFLATTHTREAEPFDALESVAGYNNYSTKGGSDEGYVKKKTSLRDTILNPVVLTSGKQETVKAAAVRELLLEYPRTRALIVGFAVKYGVAATLRGETWAAALGVKPFWELKRAYESVDLQATSADDDQIAKDVPRCHQYNSWLGSPEGKRKLGRILKVWVVLGGPIDHGRYIQGMASLVAPLLALNFHNEEVAFGSYTALLDTYPYLACDPRAGYVLLRPCFYGFLAFHDAALWATIEALEVPDDVFLSRLRTHFAHDLPLDKIYLVWDALILGPKNLLFAFAASLLITKRAEITAAPEVTEATQIWKNSMLELNVESCITKARLLLSRQPVGLSGPPAWFEKDGDHRAAPVLPCAWLDKSECRLQPESVVFVDTAWLPGEDCHVRVPLHGAPSAHVVDKLEFLLQHQFGLGRRADAGGARVAILGLTQNTPPPMPKLYPLASCGAAPLAAALVRRGWDGVVVYYGHSASPPIAVQPASTVYSIVDFGTLPGYLPPTIWSHILEYLASEEVFAVAAVCRGLEGMVMKEQQAQFEGARQGATSSGGRQLQSNSI
ncbi:TBC domain-containing protein kinase-like protein [Diplonema papillatum]|nr:TBC domain-containing protein kinase-like protein [Diplonema papillatum]